MFSPRLSPYSARSSAVSGRAGARQHVEVVDGALLGRGSSLPLSALEDLKRRRAGRRSSGSRRCSGRRAGSRRGPSAPSIGGTSRATVAPPLAADGQTSSWSCTLRVTSPRGPSSWSGSSSSTCVGAHRPGPRTSAQRRVELGDGGEVDPTVLRRAAGHPGIVPAGSMAGCGGLRRGLVERARHHLDGLDVVADDGHRASASHRTLSECAARGRTAWPRSSRSVCFTAATSLRRTSA